MRYGREAKSNNNDEVVNTSNRVDLNNLIKVRDEEKNQEEIMWSSQLLQYQL